MDIRELAGLLIFYGDHKDHCKISRIISHRAATNSDGPTVYPPCDCGWTKTSKAAAKAIELASKY